MQIIERKALAQAQISGGADKGSAAANGSSTSTLDASGITIPQGSTVTISVNAGSSATAQA